MVLRPRQNDQPASNRQFEGALHVRVECTWYVPQGNAQKRKGDVDATTSLRRSRPAPWTLQCCDATNAKQRRRTSCPGGVPVERAAGARGAWDLALRCSGGAVCVC